MNNIPRPYYLERITPYIGNNLIKVLVGQRRVGKSYLLLQIANYIQEKFPDCVCININKELYEYDQLKNYEDLISYIEAHAGTGHTALFIDEVQDISEFEKALRNFQAQEKYDIYITGSNSKLLSGELSTMLAGRYIQIHVFSLSYSEYLAFNNLDDNDSSLLRYIKFGGLPHLTNIPFQEQFQYEYLRNVFDSSVLKDIISRYNIRNVRLLNDLITFVADNTGSIITANTISKYLKNQQISLSPKQIIAYLQYVESAFLIDEVKRQDITGKKIFEIGEKYYFEDCGIRNARIGYRPADIGKILENLVYIQLVRNQYEVTVGKQENSEVDFIAEKNGNKVYIQVAYTVAEQQVYDREFGNLLAIRDAFPKYVLSMDAIAEGNEQGVNWWHIRKFLREFS